MADRSVVVRLKAEVDAYVANMKKAGRSTADFGKDVGKATKQGAQDLDGFIAKAEASSRKMGDVGKKMSTNLSLPLAAVGVAAGKLALDFESTFSRMEGLAGVSADEVDGLKASVLGMAGEVGKGPQELAEALYFVRSAGLDGQAAMDALEMSAKGAAAGLGQTAAVADAVTSAMNGYGAEVLSAAEATDVLVATAREGKAEASQLAPQFGRLIPVAAELGISFDQVGAGLAFLSRASGDASLSATQLDGVMAKLIKPSQQGAAALEAVGMSTDSIRASIRENGLLSTLETLRAQLGDTGFVKFFDDVQGLQGALQLTGAQADEARGVFDALAQSAGATDDAFAKWADTVGFKNKKAFAELQSAMIELGDQLAPLIGQVAEWASALLGWFTALDDGSKAMVVTFGVFMAALGPALSMAGRLTTAVKALGDAYAWAKVQAGLFATGGLSAMSLGAPAAIAALVATAGAVHAYGSAMDDARSDADKWADSFAGTFDPAKASMAELQAEIFRLGDAANEMESHADALNPFESERYKEAASALRGTIAPLAEVASGAIELQNTLGISADEALRMATNQDLMAQATDTATGAIDEEAAATALATSELQGYMDALSGLFDPLFAMQDALGGEAAARQAVADAIRDHGEGSREAIDAQGELTRALVDTDAAALRLKAGIEDGSVSLAEARGQLDQWVASGRLTAEQADTMAYFIGIAAGKADEFAGTYTATFEADTATAESQIAALKNSIATVPKTVPYGFIGPLLPGQALVEGPVPQTRSAGGMIVSPAHLALGGSVSAGAFPGQPSGTDTVPAWLSPGEYVMQRSAVARFGVNYMDSVNAGVTPATGITSTTTTTNRAVNMPVELKVIGDASPRQASNVAHELTKMQIQAAAL